MTTENQTYKWLLYALGVLPVWLAESLVLSRMPLLGVIPVLLPLTAVAVALLEGALPGALFGLCVGVLADAVYPGAPGGMTLGVCLMGWLTGAVSQYGVRQNCVGYLLCCCADYAALELFRVAWGTLTALGRVQDLVLVALKEGLWSLCFALPVYGLFRLIYRRVGGETLGG